jgi:two-component system, cell cycle sensor histidine kinase and response regulator CckA
VPLHHSPGSDLLPELLRAVIDNLPISVYTKDVRGRFVLNNARNLRLLGVAAEGDVRGKTVFDFFPAEIAKAFDDDDRNVLDRGRVVQREEPFVDPVTGRTGWFHTTKIPLRLPDGSGIAGLVGVSRDITAEKMAEQQDQQAQRLESLGALSAGVAHDFNNLLTVILGALAVLRQHAGVPVPPLEHIETAVDHAAHLTRQLLTFSRKQVVQPRLVELHRELPQIRTLLARLMPETIVVETGMEGEAWPVLIDPVQLTQVLINLAINARDAMPRGGRVVLRVRNRVLKYADTTAPGDMPPGDYVEIAVADTGHGLSPQVKLRLFEPFFTTKEEGQGTGLGLATSWTIVTAAGGFIRAESQEGQGATFRVFLPRAAEGPAPVVAPLDAASTPASGGDRVLVVEDNDAVRATLVELLTTSGYHVHAESDGESGIRAAEADAEPLGFLVTDMMLPGVSGLDVARAVQARHPECRVLFITGYLDLVLRNALPAGASLLQKPFSMRSLLGELDKLRPGTGTGTGPGAGA